ncbi:hypothetical protein LCGC14_1690140 [marine sediment metagenome]|uniref:Uncharacterized protein n=1 Tax=marine sediment metagenome TaxID=412755 RepID=A0A0F9KL83_9ZZZZ
MIWESLGNHYLYADAIQPYRVLYEKAKGDFL